MIFRRTRFTFILDLCFILVSIPVSAAPRVVVSIPPVHSLVASVMQGIAEPVLLVTGGQSPHSSSLRPSLIRELTHADLLVWISPEFELSLKKPVSGLKDIKKMMLIDIPAMHLLKARHSGEWQAVNSHSEPPSAEPHESIFDFHLWLSPYNARVIVEEVAAQLIKMDPLNAARYKQNTQQTVARIGDAQAEINASLLPFQAQHYMVYHDAYQYFERDFNMNAIGSMTQNPERKLGLKSLLQIKQGIVEGNVKCLFYEPQFRPRMLKQLADQTGLATAELDPIGANIATGPNLWFELMFALRDSLTKCL